MIDAGQEGVSDKSPRPECTACCRRAPGRTSGFLYRCFPLKGLIRMRISRDLSLALVCGGSMKSGGPPFCHISLSCSAFKAIHRYLPQSYVFGIRRSLVRMMDAK
jgi:hypothetical protein